VKNYPSFMMGNDLIIGRAPNDEEIANARNLEIQRSLELPPHERDAALARILRHYDLIWRVVRSYRDE
jgi:hypothetical protein